MCLLSSRRPSSSLKDSVTRSMPIFVNTSRKQPAKQKKEAMYGYANQGRTQTEATALK